NSFRRIPPPAPLAMASASSNIGTKKKKQDNQDERSALKTVTNDKGILERRTSPRLKARLDKEHKEGSSNDGQDKLTTTAEFRASSVEDSVIAQVEAKASREQERKNTMGKVKPTAQGPKSARDKSRDKSRSRSRPHNRRQGSPELMDTSKGNINSGNNSTLSIRNRTEQAFRIIDDVEKNIMGEESNTTNTRTLSTSLQSTELNDDTIVIPSDDGSDEGSRRNKTQIARAMSLEKKKQKWAQQAENEEKGKLREMLDPRVAPTLSKSRREKERKLMEQLKYAPTEKLPNVVLEQVRTLDKYINRAKIQGPIQGHLNTVAATVTAAVTRLVGRMGNEPGTEHNSELDELRNRLSALEEKNRQLRKRIEANHRPADKVAAMEVSPQTSSHNSPINRSKSRVNRFPEDSSSDEEERKIRENEKRKNSEINKRKILEEIAKEGTPPVYRAALRGVRPVLLDPGIPPGGAAPLGIPQSELSLEERILHRLSNRMEMLLAPIMGKFNSLNKDNKTKAAAEKASTSGKKSSSNPPAKPSNSGNTKRKNKKKATDNKKGRNGGEPTDKGTYAGTQKAIEQAGPSSYAMVTKRGKKPDKQAPGTMPTGGNQKGVVTD
ncbi:uncharacterized protein LOC112454107, partial [Temnothorax curvispinosus]|uniref:Uncharacterized protein LOC112454107 n=1 Tax=Temnothorax curvispinosus TaxID=300111 RepID=A0A6J1PN03_9HYME